MNAKTFLTAASLATAFVAASAHGANVDGVVDNAARNTAVHGTLARTGQRDAYTDGARGRIDPYLDGALVAGMDRSGPSAPPARQRDAYTDGARA
ncbi:hypothetical protein ACKI2N_025405 [Cupriavidus sp. 30B13]|uniref:hypothetical protein n=1 Tax=Cupriavidus sp. 30B13 TaxID=3384241 RepID=UPI003B91E1AD